MDVTAQAHEQHTLMPHQNFLPMLVSKHVLARLQQRHAACIAAEHARVDCRSRLSTLPCRHRPRPPVSAAQLL